MQIQRHGARYPTGGATERIQAALAQFENVTEYKDEKIAFVEDYHYDLGVSSLIAFGARQSVICLLRSRRIIDERSLGLTKLARRSTSATAIWSRMGQSPSSARPGRSALLTPPTTGRQVIQPLNLYLRQGAKALTRCRLLCRI